MLELFFLCCSILPIKLNFLFNFIIVLLKWEFYPWTHSPNAQNDWWVGQAESRSLKLNPGLPDGWQGPQNYYHHLLPPIGFMTWMLIGHKGSTWTKAFQYGIWASPAGACTAKPNAALQKDFWHRKLGANKATGKFGKWKYWKLKDYKHNVPNSVICDYTVVDFQWHIQSL